jgi:hypothetical protein
MSKLIALKSGNYEILDDAWNSDFSNLKQQALLFDQIGIYKLSNFYENLNESLHLFKKLAPNFPTDKAETIITEMEWLQQNGIVFELKLEEELSNPHLKLFNASSSYKFDDAKNLLRKVIEIQTNDLKNVRNEKLKIELIKEQQFTLLRLLSIIMETTKGVSAVTTFPYTEYTRELPNSSKSNIAQVVINNLPLPSNETPWEQIIDYRNDAETQKLLLSLRRWIGKISTENSSPLEIEEEIESLIHEFQEHMKFHNMKANTEALEVIVNSTADVLGNLLTLKFSKIIEPLFAIKKRQLSLLEAELSAPGKAMAYIIKSREAFQPHE